MIDEKTLGFDDDPEDFPSIWESGEDGVDVTVRVGDEEVVETTVEVDEIINKHVYLALQDYMKNDCWLLLSPVTYEPEGKIVCEVTIGLGDHQQRVFNIESEAESLGNNMYSKEELLGMAQSLERAAQILRGFAETQK